MNVWSGMVGVDPRLNECWHWFSALWAFDYGNPEPLASLIQSEPIPPEFSVAVANIVKGQRKPNLKASVKSKIPAIERARLAASLSVMFGLIDDIKFRAWESEDLKPGVITIADRKGVEPREIIGELKAQREQIVNHVCTEFSISQETVENLLREARERVALWPSV